jgi:threonine aldolase
MKYGLNIKDQDIDFVRFVGHFDTKEEALEAVIEEYKRRGNNPVDYDLYEDESE